MEILQIRPYHPLLPSFPDILKKDKWPRLLSAINWTKSVCSSLTLKHVTLIAVIGAAAYVAFKILRSHKEETQPNPTKTIKLITTKDELIRNIDNALEQLNNADQKNPEQKLALCKRLKTFWTHQILENPSIQRKYRRLPMLWVTHDYEPQFREYEASMWGYYFNETLKPDSKYNPHEIDPHRKLDECVATLKYIFNRAKNDPCRD